MELLEHNRLYTMEKRELEHMHDAKVCYGEEGAGT